MAQRPRLVRLGRRRVRLPRLGRRGRLASRNPFYSALALIGNLGSLAVLYLLLSAEFVAAAQVLVYAGAVMVMFLFVIAYLGGRADAPWAGGPAGRRSARSLAAGAILVEIDRRDRAQGRRTRSRDEAEITRAFGSPARDRARSS